MGSARVVQVAEDISSIAGGIPAVVRQLSEKISLQGMPVQVVYASGGKNELPAKVEPFFFPASWPGSVWSWGKGLRSAAAGLAKPLGNDQPVFHIHGAWSAPQYFAARAAYKAGVPFIFSAHGMLEPWLWNEQGLLTRMKKRLYWKLFAYPALSKATVIHAITPLEREHLAALFPGNRIEVIPNAIDVENAPVSSPGGREKSILFLGRVEPKKGVDILLNAFGQANLDQDWRVKIVGPVWSAAYMAQLESIVAEFGLADRVSFHAPVFGEEKTRLLDQAWVMVLPSHSEVVGLVNLETAARNLPSITTRETGLHDWESGGGMLIEPTIASLRTALEKTCCWSEQEQHERGELSRQLVENRYSWKAVIPMWMQLYTSLQDRGQATSL